MQGAIDDGSQPLTGKELRVLRALQRKAKTRFIFEIGRGTPMSVRQAQHLIEQAGRAAGLPFTVHAHMLRHSCVYKLANDGIATRTIQLYLGHRNLNHTARYTALAAGAFNWLWKD